MCHVTNIFSLLVSHWLVRVKHMKLIRSSRASWVLNTTSAVFCRRTEALPTILWQMSSMLCAWFPLISHWWGMSLRVIILSPKPAYATTTHTHVYNVFNASLSHTLGWKKHFPTCATVYRDMNHNYDCCWTPTLHIWRMKGLTLVVTQINTCILSLFLSTPWHHVNWKPRWPQRLSV